MSDIKRGEVEHYLTVDEAINKLKAREYSEIIKFKALYDVDISDLGNYDLVIDTTHFSAEEVAETIMENVSCVVGWKHTTNVILPPKLLYPTDKTTHIDFNVVKEYGTKLKKW